MTGLEAYLEDAEERDQKTEFHKRTLRRVIRHILGHKGLLASGILFILLGTGAALLEPRLFGYAIDDAIIPRDLSKLKQLAYLFILVECVRVGSVIANAYLFEKLGQHVMQDLRIALFSHLQALPVATYDKNPVGRLVTRVTNDISAMAEMFSAGFIVMIGNALVVVGIVTSLLLLDVKLGLIAITVFPFLAWVSVIFSRRLRVAYRNARSKLSALNAFLAENILGIRVVHLFNRQKLHTERFQKINNWYADAQFGSVRVFALFQPSITWASGISMALVVWYGGRMTWNGEIPLGVLVAYFSYVLTLFQPLREIADKWNVFLSGMTAAERIFSILDWKPELGVADVARPAARLEGIRGHIVFENVWFAYDVEAGKEPRWILKDFTLEVRPGMKVGVVGHTGAGKTTLISLLMRFYEPQKGRILLDGKDLRDYDRRALRQAIGIVQQDVFLFSGSVDENVSLWRDLDPRTRAAVDAIIARIGGEDLYERGSNLSAGQRQVLAFARARAADPYVWILDEATANIDSGSELVLEQQLREASAGRTSILIAHRLATVRECDLILVLHDGSLVEQGNHAALIARDGLYARLYRYQTAAAVSAAREVVGETQPPRVGF